MGRIKKIHNDVELDRYHPNDTERLLKFNITKQRVVDLCNQEFEDDPFEKEINYSSWHRGLDGHEVWEGIVQALDGLYHDQVAHPRKYLPDNDPGEDLRGWMTQIAKATWWHKTLELEMSLNVLNSWFSGRVSKTRPELREKVDAWWTRVKSVANEAERHSSVQDRDHYRENDYSYDNVRSWDTWCKDLIEDGLTLDEARERYIAEALIYDNCQFLSLINLANPVSPIEPYDRDAEAKRALRAQEFDELAGAGFPKALPRKPPQFDPAPFVREMKWGDRRDENSPKDLNTHLYGKHYRERCVRRWDASERKILVDTEIVEVSNDGEKWRPATPLEAQGWQSGIYFWEKALIDGQDTRNSYSQELEAAKLKERQAHRAWECCDQNLPSNRNVETAFREAERDLQIALDNTHGQYD